MAGGRRTLPSWSLPTTETWACDCVGFLTDNGDEFVARVFDRVARLGLAHTRITPGRPATNGHVERFHGTVLREFCRLLFRRRYYRNLAELQSDLAASLGWYKSTDPLRQAAPRRDSRRGLHPRCQPESCSMTNASAVRQVSTPLDDLTVET